MGHPVITIVDPPENRSEQVRRRLRARRWGFAALLALVEIIIYAVARPPQAITILIIGAVLVGCFWLARRLREGLGKELVRIAGLAQGMVIALPLIAGVVKFVVALIVILALIILVTTIALRFGR